MRIIFYDVRKRPPKTMGTVWIAGDKLRTSGTAAVELLATMPAGIAPDLVDPAPTEEYLRALAAQYRGTAIQAVLSED